MIRAFFGASLLALLLSSVGCTSLEEKEAQLEFERLRHTTIPQQDQVRPDFGRNSSSEEA